MDHERAALVMQNAYLVESGHTPYDDLLPLWRGIYTRFLTSMQGEAVPPVPAPVEAKVVRLVPHGVNLVALFDDGTVRRLEISSIPVIRGGV